MHMKGHQVIMVIMGYMEIMPISIMQKNTCMKVMIIKKILISFITVIITGCAISPGMQLNDVKTINGKIKSFEKVSQ